SATGSTSGRIRAARRRSCARRAAGSAAQIRVAKARRWATERRGGKALNESTLHRIVIIGGGAAGLPPAAKLGRKLARRATVTLVDRFPTHLWKPLLHEVAAGRLDADLHAVDYFLIAYWHHFRFRVGAVSGLDRTRREVRLAAVLDDDGAEILPPGVLPYDTLIFCIGSVGNDFGVPGVA